MCNIFLLRGLKEERIEDYHYHDKVQSDVLVSQMRIEI
jgi:hypothetical protein